tara:strand:+ start:1320 stop:1856 length:537 start_codon:yes stop_codon:yes gene_type:complete
MAIPSEEELAAMSLPELEALLSEKQQELSTAIEEFEMPKTEQIEEPPIEEPMEEPAAPPVEMDEFGMGMTPEKVQSATARLVESGLLDAASAEVTPELIAKLQEIADQLDPGLYDLSQPEQLEEFIDGINNGTIELAPAGAAAPAGQPPVPVVQGGGLGGQLAGGLPPGIGGEPAPII